MADGLHQMQIRGELALADAADHLHDPGAAVVAVDGGHIVDPVGEGGDGGELKVDEVHVVRQEHIGGLQTLHIEFFDLIILADEGGLAQAGHQTCEKQGLADGELCRVVVFGIFVVDIHGEILSFWVGFLSFLTLLYDMSGRCAIGSWHR